ncbi:hypothetical protein [Pontibacter liquoris]|uniref:hypothetical protein n=1 Tax=Pontibacter liquoris TaxID=2905677 RepID=UPI001FA77A29|nr:hypothetical protein [Pontibacter liquoris]
MENEKGKKQQKPGSREQDMNDMSRSMKPGSIKDGSTTTSQNSTSSPGLGGSGSITNISSSSSHQGRGWHGDPEGHAKAGSQSHKKNSGNKKEK